MNPVSGSSIHGMVPEGFFEILGLRLPLSPFEPDLSGTTQMGASSKLAAKVPPTG